MPKRSKKALPSFEYIDIRDRAILETQAKPNALTFVGGTCAGKSTLAEAITLGGPTSLHYEFAPRISTRAPRLGDDREEIKFVSWPEFRALRAADALALSWIRPLGDAEVGYGCEQVAGDRIGVQLAGHGIYSNPDSVHPVGALDGAVLIGVYAPHEIRAERAALRSPDIRESELTALLEHDDERMRAEVDIVVNNFGADRAAIEAEVLRLALILAT